MLGPFTPASKCSGINRIEYQRCRIDPTKVVRVALHATSSIAGLLITTEAMVAELPKKESPAMPGGGGRTGGQGGMDY